VKTHDTVGNAWMRGIDTLILVTTYRCNLRCRYCPTHKADEDMGTDIVTAAVDRYIRNPDALPALRFVRFFGAEPLLHLPAMKTVLDALPPTSPLRCMVTTNGTLLNTDTWRFLDAHPELEITVSLDGPPVVQTGNRPGVDSTDSAAWFETNREKLLARQTPVTVNMTIAPAQAEHLVENFQWLYSQGIRKFNFLPAYYVVWSDAQLDALEQGFEKLGTLIAAMWERKLRVVVKNMFVNADTAFFNRALVVDTDGDIYDTSAVLTARMRPYRHQLKMGNVLDDTLLQQPQGHIDDILNDAYSPALLDATVKVDEALTRFVERLRPQWLRHKMDT